MFTPPMPEVVINTPVAPLHWRNASHIDVHQLTQRQGNTPTAYKAFSATRYAPKHELKTHSTTRPIPISVGGSEVRQVFQIIQNSDISTPEPVASLLERLSTPGTLENPAYTIGALEQLAGMTPTKRQQPQFALPEGGVPSESLTAAIGSVIGAIDGALVGSFVAAPTRTATGMVLGALIPDVAALGNGVLAGALSAPLVSALTSLVTVVPATFAPIVATFTTGILASLATVIPTIAKDVAIGMLGQLIPLAVAPIHSLIGLIPALLAATPFNLAALAQGAIAFLLNNLALSHIVLRLLALPAFVILLIGTRLVTPIAFMLPGVIQDIMLLLPRLALYGALWITANLATILRIPLHILGGIIIASPVVALLGQFLMLGLMQHTLNILALGHMLFRAVTLLPFIGTLILIPLLSPWVLALPPFLIDGITIPLRLALDTALFVVNHIISDILAPAHILPAIVVGAIATVIAWLIAGIIPFAVRSAIRALFASLGLGVLTALPVAAAIMFLGLLTSVASSIINAFLLSPLIILKLIVAFTTMPLIGIAIAIIAFFLSTVIHAIVFGMFGLSVGIGAWLIWAAFFGGAIIMTLLTLAATILTLPLLPIGIGFSINLLQWAALVVVMAVTMIFVVPLLAFIAAPIAGAALGAVLAYLNPLTWLAVGVIVIAALAIIGLLPILALIIVAQFILPAIVAVAALGMAVAAASVTALGVTLLAFPFMLLLGPMLAVFSPLIIGIALLIAPIAIAFGAAGIVFALTIIPAVTLGFLPALALASIFFGGAFLIAVVAIVGKIPFILFTLPIAAIVAVLGGILSAMLGGGTFWVVTVPIIAVLFMGKLMWDFFFYMAASVIPFGTMLALYLSPLHAYLVNFAIMFPTVVIAFLIGVAISILCFFIGGGAVLFIAFAGLLVFNSAGVIFAAPLVLPALLFIIPLVFVSAIILTLIIPVVAAVLAGVASIIPAMLGVGAIIGVLALSWLVTLLGALPAAGLGILVAIGTFLFLLVGWRILGDIIALAGVIGVHAIHLLHQIARTLFLLYAGWLVGVGLSLPPLYIRGLAGLLIPSTLAGAIVFFVVKLLFLALAAIVAAAGLCYTIIRILADKALFTTIAVIAGLLIHVLHRLHQLVRNIVAFALGSLAANAINAGLLLVRGLIGLLPLATMGLGAVFVGQAAARALLGALAGFVAYVAHFIVLHGATWLASTGAAMVAIIVNHLFRALIVGIILLTSLATGILLGVTLHVATLPIKLLVEAIATTAVALTVGALSLVLAHFIKYVTVPLGGVLGGLTSPVSIPALIGMKIGAQHGRMNAKRSPLAVTIAQRLANTLVSKLFRRWDKLTETVNRMLWQLTRGVREQWESSPMSKLAHRVQQFHTRVKALVKPLVRIGLPILYVATLATIGALLGILGSALIGNEAWLLSPQFATTTGLLWGIMGTMVTLVVNIPHLTKSVL